LSSLDVTNALISLLVASVLRYCLINLSKEYNDLWHKKTCGARIRARIKQYEEGEKSTKFFFSQEKVRSRSKLWHQVKDKNGNIKIGINNILDEQVSFYSKLMSSEGWDREAAETLLSNINIKITEEQKELCEKQISENELGKAVTALKKNKSPGFDGIPSEFYIKYWNLIKNCFIKVVKEIEDTEELCISQYRGVICLLYKKGDRDDVNNWRPITLLNTDYKLIAIIYASRLKKVLPAIINDDQKAYIEGRQIIENVRLTEDIISMSDEFDSPGAIIFLDQQKAYDRVEWGYLEMCLNKFGFGPKFCSWILMLYKCGQSSILTNGFLSRFFRLSRSLRQGCPIASYLYVLQAEPMAQSIRNNDKIKGIVLPTPNPGDKITTKISMFADDTQLFHSTEASIVEGFRTLDVYCKASGAKLNIHKTKGLYIGQWKNKEPKFKKIKWAKSVGGLGTEFGYNINYEEIWMKKFFKFKKKILKWKNRDLTLEGKKMLIYSYIMSSISYLADVYTFNIPQTFLRQTKDLIRDFLWSGKSWRIAQKTLALRKEHGGLELQDIDNFILCKKIKWILKINFSKLSSWNAYGKYCLHKCDNKYGIENFLLQCSNLNGLSVNLPGFYKTCMQAWCKIIGKQNVNTRDGVLNQNIFGNCNIKWKQQSIFLANWTQSKIWKIRDLWDIETNTWIDGRAIHNQLQNKRNWIAEYNKIRTCIPDAWKQILKGEAVDLESPLLKNTKDLQMSHSDIRINNKVVDFKKIKQKEIYFACLYPAAKPSCVIAWSRIFQMEVNLKDIFTGFKHLIHNRKGLNFHWKTLHRAIYSETRLQKMNKSDGKCKLCLTEDETICHLLVNCTIVKPIWNRLQNVLHDVTKHNLPLNTQNIIFGITNNQAASENARIIYNFVIFIAKWYVWKHRNNVIYSNQCIKDRDSFFISIINGCKQEVDIIMRSKNSCKLNTDTKEKLLELSQLIV